MPLSESDRVLYAAAGFVSIRALDRVNELAKTRSARLPAGQSGMNLVPADTWIDVGSATSTLVFIFQFSFGFCADSTATTSSGAFTDSNLNPSCC
jgi:hypothetical protein